jgi:hypothetical protein
MTSEAAVSGNGYSMGSATFIACIHFHFDGVQLNFGGRLRRHCICKGRTVMESLVMYD